MIVEYHFTKHYMNLNKNNNDNNPWGSDGSGGGSTRRDFEDSIKKA